MPGIELYGRRSSDDSDYLRQAELLQELYQRALIALNQYVILKLGTGKAPVAGLLLNHIFADQVLEPSDRAVAEAARELDSVAAETLAARTRELLENFPALRRPLVSTLWVKRIIDLAHGRKSSAEALDRSPAFRTYSEDYRFPLPKEYEIVVRDFEQQLEFELGDFISRQGDIASTAGESTSSNLTREVVLDELALYTEALHEALEHETFNENRIHHLGHLAAAARMFARLHLRASSISLRQIYRLEINFHAGKLPGETAGSVRDAWTRFEPFLKDYLDSMDREHF